MPHAAELAAAYVLTKAATTAGLVLWVRRRNGKGQTKRRAVAVELVGPRTPRRRAAAPPDESPVPQRGRRQLRRRRPGAAGAEGGWNAGVASGAKRRLRF